MKQENILRLYKFHSLIYDCTRPFFLFWHKKAVRNLWILKEKTIIDYGCWTWKNYKILTEHTADIKYIWIDISEDMLQIARKKYGKGRFLKEEISRYQNACDISICTYVLSMVDNYEGVITNISNNLKPGWTCIILDFYPFTWILRRCFPFFKFFYFSWVDPEKPIIETLEKKFILVDTYISPLWNYFISVCKK